MVWGEQSMTMLDDSDPLVLIIGAGAAGISAARYFQQNNIPFRLIEASHRVGGGAYSEAYKTGGWFDLGCSYLHEGEINPLVPFVAEAGLGLGDGDRFVPENWFMQQDSSGVSAETLKAYIDFEDEVYARMTALADDTSIAALMDWASPFAAVYGHLMSGLNASDVTDQSVADHLKAGSGKDYPVIGGLGRLVSYLAADIPVELNCAAERIDWGGGAVRVETNKGVITAARVIITVSTGILQSGRITFSPALPDDMLTALNRLRCGTLNKIGVALDGGFAADIADGWHVNFPVADASDDRIASVDVISGAQPQAVVFAGGSFGEYLEKQGMDAMRDYAETCLVDLFGGTVRGAIRDMIATAWRDDPLTMGAYSYALPHGSAAREKLAAPIAGKLFLAGETISKQHYGTCHGAYISGLRAAKATIDI